MSKNLVSNWINRSIHAKQLNESWSHTIEDYFPYSEPESFGNTKHLRYKENFSRLEETPEYKELMRTKTLTHFMVDRWLDNFKNFDFVIPEGTVKLDTGAFAGFPITSVSIPKSVREIEKLAFYNCQDLTLIELPDNIVSLKEKTFSQCYKLASIKLPANLQYIGYSVFQYCRALKSIDLPSKLIIIKKEAFSGCESLESIRLPESLDGKLRLEMFMGCASLKDIYIPQNIKEIRNGVFAGCVSLKTIDLPQKLEYLASNLFTDCKSLETVTIPDTVEDIGVWTFGGCTSLKTIVIPASVKYIYDNAFEKCPNLKSVVFEGKTMDEIENIKTGEYNDARNGYPFGLEHPEEVIKAEGNLQSPEEEIQEKDEEFSLNESSIFNLWKRIIKNSKV